MSKQQCNCDGINSGCSDATCPSQIAQAKTYRMFSDSDFRKLEGELLTLIETLGITQKQEESIKSFTRRIIWGSYAAKAVYQSNNELIPKILEIREANR
jgi:hypothetical protein